MRPTTAEVGGRATIVGTNVQTGSNMNSENRRLTSRSATAGVSTASPASVTSIEESSAIMDSCIAQYTDCMDQFYAIIDPNQKDVLAVIDFLRMNVVQRCKRSKCTIK